MSVHISQDQLDSAQRLTQAQWKKMRAELGRVTIDPKKNAGLHDEGVLLGYQRRLLESTANNRVTVIDKSRRTGATWALAVDAVLTSATSKEDHGMDTLYIGYNHDMAREFIDTAAEWAEILHGLTLEIEESIFRGKDADGNDKDILAFSIRFASGFEIIALTSNPRSLRGRQGYVIIDEAAFHDDFEGLLKAAVALLMWGGKICIISTQNGDDNPYNKLLNDVLAGKKNYSIVRFDFDDALKDGLYERICLKTGQTWTPENEAQWRSSMIADYGDDADEELYCIPSKGSGTFLSGQLIRARQIEVPVIRWEPDDGFVHLPEATRKSTVQDWLEENVDPVLATLDPNLRHCFGNDFGRVADLTVLWPVAVERTMNLTTPFIVELRNVPFEEQKQIFFYILDRLPRLSSGAMDGGGNGAYLAETVQQKYGAHAIEIINFSQNFYRENMPKFKAAFEDDDFTVPKDDDVYNDFRAIRKVNGVAQIPSDKRTLELASKGRKRHGDSAIAGFLAHYASEMEVSEYAYQSIHDKSDDDFDDDDDDFGGSTLFNTRHDGLVS